MTYRISLFKEHDFHALKAKFSEVYGNNPRLQEEDFFEWQFKKNPYNRSGYNFWISWKGDAVDGFIGCIPLKFIYSKSVFMGADIVNWCGGGSALPLLYKVFEKYDHRFFHAFTPSANNIYSMLRIPTLKAIPRLIVPFNAEAIIDLFHVGKGNLQDKIVATEERCRLLPVTERMSLIDRFAPKATYRNAFDGVIGSLVLDSEYLNWRYKEIPRHQYMIIAGPDDQFAVIREEKISNTEFSVLRIVEWNICPMATVETLGRLKEIFCGRNLILADIFCTARTVRDELLGTECFLSCPVSKEHPIPYLYRPIHFGDGYSVGIDLPPHRKRRSIDFDSWHISKGWSDMDRVKS